MNAETKVMTPQDEWDAMVPRLRAMEQEVERMRRAVLPIPKTDQSLRSIRFAIRCALGDFDA